MPPNAAYQASFSGKSIYSSSAAGRSTSASIAGIADFIVFFEMSPLCVRNPLAGGGIFWGLGLHPQLGADDPFETWSSGCAVRRLRDRPTEALVAHVAVSRYADHQPLYP
jgi:hypothetical protein